MLGLDCYNDPMLEEFCGVSVFGGSYAREEVGNGRNFNVIGDILLSENEELLLDKNPKLASLGKFEEETFEREREVAGVKVR